jgi:isoaspartyl peptidase/L-asparaginase-like protein (Ntn-hydrolase superfamily)
MTRVNPKLIIHGGASSLEDKGGLESVRDSLRGIVKNIYNLLDNGASAVEAVTKGCMLLEFGGAIGRSGANECSLDGWSSPAFKRCH